MRFLCLILALFAARTALGQVAAATTVQLPTFGVSVDAQGLFDLKQFEDPTGQLRRQRVAAAEQKLAADLWANSKLRKISLTRLELAVAQRIADQKPLDESMLYLAGLQ